MKVKKSLGQHFLTNDGISKRIAHSLSLSGYESLIEIGPGRGALTKNLVELPIGHLSLIETDRELIPFLEEKFPRTEILHADFLKLPLDALLKGRQTAVAGNFPYNISSQIIFKVLDHTSLIPEVVGMFQKEMAQRIIAPPGSKDYGIISVLTQAHYSGKLLFLVKNTNFNPPPKVQSAVIRLTRKEDVHPVVLTKAFKTVVKQSFSQRRKMLRNTLKPFIPDNIRSSDFFMQRPEQLSLNDFIYITECMINNQL